MVGLESGQGRIQSGPRLCRRTRRRSGGGHRSLEKLLDELAPMEPHIGLGSHAYPHFAQPVTASAHAAPTQVAQSFLSVPKRPTIAPHHHPIPPKTPVQTPHAQVTLPPCSNPYPIRTILPSAQLQPAPWPARGLSKVATCRARTTPARPEPVEGPAGQHEDEKSPYVPRQPTQCPLPNTANSLPQIRSSARQYHSNRRQNLSIGPQFNPTARPMPYLN